MHRLPPRSFLIHILAAAVRVDDAVGGSVLTFDREARELVLAAGAGLSDEFHDHFAVVRGDDGSACAQAMVERRRVVIRDIERDALFAPHLDVARRAGFRAVQSTPLVDADRQLLGVLSTHFAEPHHPSTDSLAKIDLCCQAATLLLECEMLGLDIDSFDRRLGVPYRALSPASAQAANAARTLLPLLEQDVEQVLVSKVVENLDGVASELRALHKRLETA